MFVIPDAKTVDLFTTFITTFTTNVRCNSSPQSVYSTRIGELDEALYQEARAKERSAEYQSMLKERKKLPAFQAQKAVLESIRQNQVLLISGETGT